MKKKQLIEFLNWRYNDEDELVWQTISQDDVGATDYAWAQFIEDLDGNSVLADAISEVVFEYFEQWVADKGGNNGDL